MAKRFDVYSFRVRILLGFLLISGTTIGIALLGFWYQQQSYKLSHVHSLSERLMLDVVRMQKAEAEFNSSGLVDNGFFETGEHLSLLEHGESHADIQQCLELLAKTLPTAMHSEQEEQLHAKIDSMEVGVTLLQVQFRKYAALMRKRGFLSYGLMGEMRETAHTLESSGKLNLVDLLQMRRHEKDYLLRRDTVYYRKARQAGERLLNATKADGGKEAERELLNQYLSGFAQLVQLERELGITVEFGLQKEISEGSEVLTNQVDALNATLLEESLSLGNRYRRIFLAIAGLAILLAVGLSLYFSIKISDPLQNIMRYIRTEISQQFVPSPNRLVEKGRGEIRDLSNDINAMVRQIRRQLGEIKAQGDALADRNMALEELNIELRETHTKQAAMLQVREKVHSIISHDLRAPINGMIGYLHLLHENPEEFGPAEIGRFASQMLQSASRLNEMMENLLRWSLFHSGELACNLEELQLTVQVQRALDLYSDLASKKGITLLNGLDREWHVSADKEMLNFILRNLLTNAIKFSKQGGRVEVFAHQLSDGRLQVSVKDDGVGMTMDQVSRILVKGEHVTTTGTQKEKGTGFGLLLCRDFVVHQGGMLTVQSAVGSGTQVDFTLVVQEQ